MIEHEASALESDFIFTYDRDLIVECAQALMLRIANLEKQHRRA